MIVIVDASVAVKWFVREAGHEDALALIEANATLEAPDLAIAEVANIAWKKHRLGEIGRAQAEAITEALPHYLGHLWPSRSLAPRALALAIALDQPVYDGLYLAAAEAAGGRLVTADRRLVGAANAAGLDTLVHPLGASLPGA